MQSPISSNPTAGLNQLLKVQNYDATPAATDYATFTYDPDGSMVERTQYDPLGAPMFEERYSYSSWRGLTTGFEREDLPPPPAPSILWSWEYRYNAMGEREQKREMQSPTGADSLPGHSWTYYLLNGTKEQLSVWSGASATSAGTCSWLSGPVAYLYPSEYLVYAVEYPGIREDIPRIKLTPDGVPEYRITDHLASVRQTLDENGQTVNQLDYEPYGAVLSSQGVERQGFNSREHDGEDDLSNNGVRKLDEGLGRFVAVDPHWERYLSTSPYLYAANSPMIAADPDGKDVVLEEGASQVDQDLFHLALNQIIDQEYSMDYSSNRGAAKDIGDVMKVVNGTQTNITVRFVDDLGTLNIQGEKVQPEGVTVHYWKDSEGKEYSTEDALNLTEDQRSGLVLSRTDIYLERGIVNARGVKRTWGCYGYGHVS